MERYGFLANECQVPAWQLAAVSQVDTWMSPLALDAETTVSRPLYTVASTAPLAVR
jgi:hypothetical protein